MKKCLFAAFLGFALVFTGCASKATDTVPEDLISESIEIGLEDEENQVEETQEEDFSTDENQSLEENDETEGESEETEAEENLFDEDQLEEIDEPVVRDAPLEDEAEDSEGDHSQEEEASTVETVEIEELEIIPVITDEDEETVLEDNNLSSDDVMDVEDEISLVTEEDEEESLSEETEEQPEDAEIIPSRTVKIRIGEYLDVEYPGRGWVYLGITDLSKNVTYFGRKLGTENTKYTFLGKEGGTVILHFYKEDVLTGTYIDDYLEVEIDFEKTTSKVHVTAPAYSEIVPKPVAKNTEKEPEVKTEEKPTKEKDTLSENQTVVKKAPVKSKENTVSQKEPASKEEPAKESVKEETLLPALSPDELLSAAKKDFENKNYESSLENVQAFLLTAPSNADEGWYLLGQIYESNSPVRDIKKAVEAYEKITSSYPASQLWDDANKRSVYLKRFYINVR